LRDQLHALSAALLTGRDLKGRRLVAKWRRVA
jgi:hypothetical protein